MPSLELESPDSGSAGPPHTNGQHVVFRPADRSLPQVVVTPAAECDEVVLPTSPGPPITQEVLAEMDARLESNGFALDGELAMTLMWNTCDDLDIAVGLPGGLGEISRHSGQVNGVTVHAAKVGESGGASPRPVLHVHWPLDAIERDSQPPPHGQYVVRSRLLQKQASGPVHWTCRVLLRGSLHAVTEGVCSQDGADVEVVRFVYNGKMHESESDASDMWVEDAGSAPCHSACHSAASEGGSSALSESEEDDLQDEDDDDDDDDDVEDETSENEDDAAQSGEYEGADAAIPSSSCLVTSGAPTQGPDSMLDGSDLEETF